MPKQFGRYRLDRLIGRGGMGEVWAAYDPDTERMVALKLLTADREVDDAFRRRFDRESRLAASLTHPHIIGIHHFGKLDGRLYIEMPLVEGEDLGALLAREGPLDPLRAVLIVGQVARALNAAHANGLVHRDVKPSNILLARKVGNDHAYLIDFGISRSVRGAGARTITGEGTVVGTRAYMAPERFTGAPGDHRSDVYSLACVLFEALTNEKPFPGEDQRRAHLEKPPRAPSEVRPEVPREFNGVTGRGMAKLPHSRYETAGALATAAALALTSSLKSGPTSSKGPGDSRASRADAPPPTKVMPAPKAAPARHPLPVGRWLTAATTVAVLVAGGITGWTWWTDRPVDQSIPVGTSPVAVAVTPDGVSAYVVNNGSDSVSVIDMATHMVKATIPVGHSPVAVGIGRGGDRAYVVNSGSDSVSVVDLVTGTVPTTIPVGDDPSDIALTADGTHAYVSNAGSVTVIDTVTGTTTTLDVNRLPWDGLSGVAVSPDGTRLIVTLPRAAVDDIAEVIEPATDRVLNRITVGDDPRGVVMSADGRRAYVANSSSHTVSVVDVPNGAVTTVISVGDQPQGIVVSPDGTRAYVTYATAGDATVIDTRTNLVTSTLPAGGPMAISPNGRQACMLATGLGTATVVDLG